MNKEILKTIVENKTYNKHDLGLSKEVYIASYKNKKYILRIVKKKEKIKRYLQIYKKLTKYDFLPKIYSSFDNYILIEHIKGRNCTKKDANKVAFSIGKICAQINKEGKNIKFDIGSKFDNDLSLIKKRNLINKEEAKKINQIYKNLAPKKIKIILDANDVFKDNFRIYKKKVYFVDIDAIKPRLEGRGISKAFLRWFKTPEQQKKFKRGYESVRSLKFFTPKYRKFCYLNLLVNSSARKIIEKREINNTDLIRLKYLINN